MIFQDIIGRVLFWEEKYVTQMLKDKEKEE
jgi:hypothetical protein